MQGYEALKSKWKAMHQANRHRGIADGNDTTPMDVDALMKGKTREKARAKRRAKTKANTQAKERARTSPRKEHQTRRM